MYVNPYPSDKKSFKLSVSLLWTSSLNPESGLEELDSQATITFRFIYVLPRGWWLFKKPFINESTLFKNCTFISSDNGQDFIYSTINFIFHNLFQLHAIFSFFFINYFFHLFYIWTTVSPGTRFSLSPKWHPPQDISFNTLPVHLVPNLPNPTPHTPISTPVGYFLLRLLQLSWFLWVQLMTPPFFFPELRVQNSFLYVLLSYWSFSFVLNILTYLYTGYSDISQN